MNATNYTPRDLELIATAKTYDFADGYFKMLELAEQAETEAAAVTLRRMAKHNYHYYAA